MFIWKYKFKRCRTIPTVPIAMSINRKNYYSNDYNF